MLFVLQLFVGMATLAAIVSCVGLFAAVLLLLPHLDRRTIEAKTGRSLLWVAGELNTPIEFYRESGHFLWRLRNYCRRAFFVSLILLAVVFIGSALLGIPLTLPK